MADKIYQKDVRRLLNRLKRQDKQALVDIEELGPPAAPILGKMIEHPDYHIVAAQSLVFLYIRTGDQSVLDIIRQIEKRGSIRAQYALGGFMRFVIETARGMGDG